MPDPATVEDVQPQTPYEFLALFPGAPTEDQIEGFRPGVPGGRLRLFPMPDGKRLFLLRGFSGLELAMAQAEALKAPADKQSGRVESFLIERCVIWCSLKPSGKLTDSDLNSAGAGLSSTLYFAIADLSDFMQPQMIEQLYVDL